MARKLTVLCVDDDEDTLLITGLALELDRDIGTLPARNGADALRLLANDETAISAILLDMRMPEPSGAALLAKIRALRAHVDTPVIFLTASVGPTETIAHRSLGAIGTIAKPFDPLALADQLRRLLAG